MNRKYPGTYGFLYTIPGVPLYVEAKASSDVLSYSRKQNASDQEVYGYKKLYPAYGTYVGGTAALLTGEPVSTVIGAIGGHIVGQIRAFKFKRAILRDNAHLVSEAGQQ